MLRVFTGNEHHVAIEQALEKAKGEAKEEKEGGGEGDGEGDVVSVPGLAVP